MSIAFTRAVPDSLASCELTHLARAPIDLAVARIQHDAYEALLATLGCDVRHLPPAHAYPDSVFVEDIAVVLDELAVITRPGAESRRGETAGVAEAVAAYRPLRVVTGAATLDGGDVLRLGRVLYIGVGGRTNEPGAGQFADLVRPAGYSVRAVRIDGCLHLKSAVTEAAPGVLLVNPAWIDPRTFNGHAIIEVDPDEAFAANVLRIDATIVCAAGQVRTNARLEAAGFTVRRLDMSELAKAEAGLTCCSLIFSA